MYTVFDAVQADTMSYATVIAPCLLLSFIAKPNTPHPFVNRVLWAFCVYTEAVSVVPQLWLMRQLKVRPAANCEAWKLFLFTNFSSISQLKAGR